MGPEAILMDQIIGTHPGREGLAIITGWAVLHLRPGQTKHGWRTPVQGSMGEGWPDLILARPPRLIAAELKAPGKHPTDAQTAVLGLLERCGMETFVWWPESWPLIEKALR